MFARAQVGMGEVTPGIAGGGCGQGKGSSRKEESFYFAPYRFYYCLSIFFFNKEHVLFLSRKHVSQSILENDEKKKSPKLS